ncbi:hypothetical protein M9458_054830, partial [Cirrhinus mrigala]
YFTAFLSGSTLIIGCVSCVSSGRLRCATWRSLQDANQARYYAEGRAHEY